ncbi:TPA: glycosyltransferase family 2 protein [Klebsiella pneumoniae]|nr:glycosyltransferase family 2 protein [Klebsiella pneumoniae]
MVGSLDNPLISVLIPCYNAASFISKALLSVKNQTYKNIELIVVDDFSSDDSVVIVEKFINNYPELNIKLFTNENNKGVSYTRNKLISKSLGDYILFLDSDDFIDDDAVEYLYNIIRDNDTDIAQCLYYSEDVSGAPSGITNDFYMDGFLTGRDAAFAMLQNNITGYLWHKMFRSEIIRTVHFDANLKVFEDYEFIMTVFLNGASIAFSSQKKYHYIQRSGSLTKQSLQKYFDRVEYLDRTDALIRSHLTSENDRVILTNHKITVLSNVYINLIKNGASKETIHMLLMRFKSFSIHHILNLKGTKSKFIFFLCKYFPAGLSCLVNAKNFIK